MANINPFSLLRRRLGLLLILLAGPGGASADWTGVSFVIGSMNSDWEFSDSTREAKTNFLAFYIEERTAVGLTVGGGIGYQDLRLDSGDGGESGDFATQSLEIYLRQEFALGESVTLEGLLDYGLYTGDGESGDEDAEIDWNQVSVEIAVAFRSGNWRITPFVSYNYVDGDTSGVEGGGSFELEDPYVQGLRFEIFVEPTAFIGIELQTGSQAGGYLSFVRRY